MRSSEHAGLSYTTQREVDRCTPQSHEQPSLMSSSVRTLKTRAGVSQCCLGGPRWPRCTDAFGPATATSSALRGQQHRTLKSAQMPPLEYQARMSCPRTHHVRGHHPSPDSADPRLFCLKSYSHPRPLRCIGAKYITNQGTAVFVSFVPSGRFSPVLRPVANSRNVCVLFCFVF